MNVKNARRAVAAIFFLLGTFMGTWATRIPDFKAMLGLNDAEFGLILLVMASGAFVSFPFAGRWVDQHGTAPTTKVLTIATVCAFIALPFGTDVWIISPIAFALGFSFGALDVAMNGWGADVEKALGRPVMSSYHAVFSLGAAVGAGVGALALKFELSIGAHIWLWTAVMSVPTALALMVSWAETDRVKPEKPAPFLAVPRGALLLVGVMALIAALGEGAVTDWAALYQIQELGFSSSRAAVAFAVFSIAMVSMRFLADGLVARYGPVRIARFSGLAAFLGTALFVWGGSVWVIWVGAAIMGFGNAAIFPLAMSRAAADKEMSQGTALAAVATLGYGAFLMGPPVIGFIGEAFSLRFAFAGIAVLALSITLLAGALRVEPSSKPKGEMDLA